MYLVSIFLEVMQAIKKMLTEQMATLCHFHDPSSLHPSQASLTPLAVMGLVIGLLLVQPVIHGG